VSRTGRAQTWVTVVRAWSATSWRAYPRLQAALTRPIRWDIAAGQDDQMIKYASPAGRTSDGAHPSGAIDTPGRTSEKIASRK
jgi:hypothetical protein